MRTALVLRLCASVTVVSIAFLPGSPLWGQFPPGVDGELFYAPRIDLVKPAPLTVNVDGELDEEVWEKAQYQFGNGTFEGAPSGPDDIYLQWAAAVDGDNIYVAVMILDDVSRTGESLPCDSWNDDSFELYIDGLADGPDCAAAGTNCYRPDDAQLTIPRDNATLGVTDPDQLQIGGLAGKATCDFTEPAPEVCRGVVKDIEGGWQAEIAIPLVTEGNLGLDGTPAWSITPDHGCRIGFSIQVNDDDDGSGRDTKLVWALKEVNAGAESSWRNPGAFGAMVFIDPTRSLPKDPVTNLTCSRNPNGTLGLSWENPFGSTAGETIRILVDGTEVTTVPGDATTATLTEAQVPDDGVNHKITVDNGTCTPSSCLIRQAGFDDCGAIRFWNILGAYAPSDAAPALDVMRRDYMTDGASTEDEFEWLPGQTIETAFGVAASTSYNDGLGNPIPTVQGYEGDTGFINFTQIFSSQENVMAYAQCYVTNTTGEDMEVYWACSSDDSIQVKLNGGEIWIRSLGRGGLTSCADAAFPQDISPDQITFFDPIILLAGENRLLVKVFNGCCDWNFVGRFQDDQGNPITEGLKASLLPSGGKSPVLHLSCARQAGGSVNLAWTNPPTADPAVAIRFRVDGTEIAKTVSGDSTTATLTEAEVPRDGRDHAITVINDSGLGVTCRVSRDTAFAPPELQSPGGELFINAGGPDVLDGVGRTWKADPLYLAPDQAPTTTDDFAGEMIDLSLVDDPDVPNQAVLDERWCDCNIHYQMKVPDGTYTVTLYFSENCLGCVPAALGGTNTDPNTARVFDVEVEGQTETEYNQADAAVPPGDDGVGATLTATQLDFTANVADGLLDIRIIDRGAGNPPENAAIKAISIKHEIGDKVLFRRGDSDGKGGVPNITDGIFVLNFLFLGGPEPPCREAANADDKGGINITDGIFILNYLFQGGPAPPAPGPDSCGPEPSGSSDSVGCIAYDKC